MNEHLIVPGTGALAILNIFADGRVVLNSGSSGWLSLANISFPADN